MQRNMRLWAVLLVLPVCLRLRVCATVPEQEVFEPVQAKAVVVMEERSGRVLYAQEASLRLPMASTTKIMTALLALEQEDTDEFFKVREQDIRVEGSSMGLRAEDQVSLDALAVGMLLPSGNDAANVTAVRIAGGQRQFAQLMNERAQEIGMENSGFVTPSGLDAPGHYSTAYDMALLAREALQNERFAQICSQTKMRTEFGNPPAARWLTNHNRLLKSYPGTVGVKTGFTKASGRCLVSAARRNGIGLIVATLGCPDDWREHARLYDWFFERLELVDTADILPQLWIPVAGGEALRVRALYEPPGQVAVQPDEKIALSVAVPRFLYAPVRKGQSVGSISVLCGEQTVQEIPLTAAEDIPSKQKAGWLSRIFGD